MFKFRNRFNTGHGYPGEIILYLFIYPLLFLLGFVVLVLPYPIGGIIIKVLHKFKKMGNITENRFILWTYILWFYILVGFYYHVRYF